MSITVCKYFIIFVNFSFSFNFSISFCHIQFCVIKVYTTFFRWHLSQILTPAASHKNFLLFFFVCLFLPVLEVKKKRVCSSYDYCLSSRRWTLMIQARKLIKKCSLQLQMACSFHENNFYMYPMCFKRGWPITLVVAKK